MLTFYFHLIIYLYICDAKYNIHLIYYIVFSLYDNNCSWYFYSYNICYIPHLNGKPSCMWFSFLLQWYSLVSVIFTVIFTLEKGNVINREHINSSQYDIYSCKCDIHFGKCDFHSLVNYIFTLVNIHSLLSM